MGISSEGALARRMDEKALSRKITAYLNKTTLGFRFKFIDDFSDIADQKNKVFIGGPNRLGPQIRVRL